jgi:hypothetical protein
VSKTGYMIGSGDEIDATVLQGLAKSEPIADGMPPFPIRTRNFRFGKPTAEWNDSQSTITLDPCDPAGNDNSQPNVTVYVQNSKAAFNPSTGTVAGTADTALSTSVSTSTIIPFTMDKDGDLVVPALPVQVMTEFRVDGDNLKLQGKFRHTWGWFSTSESGWIDLHTGDDCSE